MEEPGPQGIDPLTGVDEEGTMDDLRRDLEQVLDRPVVNETGLEGAYKVHAAASLEDANDFSVSAEARNRLGSYRGTAERCISALRCAIRLRA